MKKQVAVMMSAIMLMGMPVVSFAREAAPVAEEPAVTAEAEETEAQTLEALTEETEEQGLEAEAEEITETEEKNELVTLGGFTFRVPEGWDVEEGENDISLTYGEGNVSMMLAVDTVETVKKELGLKEDEDVKALLQKMEEMLTSQLEEESGEEMKPSLRLNDFTLNGLDGLRLIWDMDLTDLFDFDMTQDVTVLTDGEEMILIAMQEMNIMGDLGQAEVGEEEESAEVVDADRALTSVLFSVKKAETEGEAE